MISKQEDLNQAIRDLQIRTSNKSDDRQQLDKILFQILGYPLIRLAKNHHRANCMGQNDLLSRQHQIQQDIRQGNLQNHQVCNCCGLFIRNEQLTYCIDFDDMKIGIGVILFFKNYLYNAGIFSLMFFIYSIYAFVTNLQAVQLGFNTQTALCYLNNDQESCGIVSLGAGSKLLQSDAKYLNIIQSWIGVAFVLLWGLANMIKSHYQRKLAIQMDYKRISASDFTIMITNFPKIYVQNSYESNLEEINRIFKTYEKLINSIYSYEVVKYNVARPLFTENQHVKERKQNMKEKIKQKQQIFRDWIRYRKSHINFPLDFNDRNKQYDKYVDFYSSQYDVITIEDVTLPSKNTIFLTMRSSKAVQEICKLNKPPSWKNLWNLCHQNEFPIQGVTIEKAPQPEQIMWQKIGFPKKSKYIRKFIIWIVTFGLIAISLGISIGIAYIDQDRVNQQISIGISLVVTVANVLIQIATMFLTYLENQHITSTQQSNIAFKIGIGQLINSIGVPIIVTIISNRDDRIVDKTWIKSGGLVEDVFFIAVFNIFVPFARLLDPFQILLKILRWWHSNPDRRLEKYGQKQLNQYFGNYIFDIGYEYAYLIKTAIFTSFFACMQPIIVLFAPIGLLFYYLVDKRNLLRHFQRPSYHYQTINRSVDLLLLFCPIAFGFGHLLVNNFISQSTDSYQTGTILANWIMVVIGVAFVFLVPLDIFYCCFKKPEFPQWDYYEKKPVIPADYDRSNPITKSKAIGEFQVYLQQLYAKKQLPDEGQFMMITMSHLRTANKRDQKKLQISNSMLRKTQTNVPYYNTNLNQYERYIQNKQLPNRKEYMNFNENHQQSNNELKLGRMTESHTYNKYKEQQNYPNLDNYEGISNYRRDL